MPFTQAVSFPRRSLPGLAQTAIALVLGLSLTGCSTTTALLAPDSQHFAFTAFSETIAADMYAAIAPAAGQERQPLVEALSGLAPVGTVFAYADTVDINMLVVPADPALDAYTRLENILDGAGLRARRIGAVTFIEHDLGERPARAPVAAAKPAPAAPAPAASSLGSATLLNAPVVASGDAAPASTPPTPPAEKEVVLASSTTFLEPAPALPQAPAPAPAMPQAEEAVASMPAATAKASAPVPAPVVLTTAPEKSALVVAAPPAVTEIAPAAAPVAAAEPAPPPAPVDPAPAAAAAVNAEAIDFGTHATGIANAGTETRVIAPDSWYAARGQTLNSVLQGWCERASVQLVWNTDFDYPLAASVTLNDTFENAVRTLLTGFMSVSPQPVARLHRQGNAGQRVLIVETRGNLYQEQ